MTDDVPEGPRRRYRLTVIDEENNAHVIDVDPAKIPYDDHGLPGSVLDICMGHHVELDHACGGVCACSTCHVHVLEGIESCNASTDDEEDELDEAYDLRPYSRLGCQCVPNGTMDVRVRIPRLNRNLEREGHGPDT